MSDSVLIISHVAPADREQRHGHPGRIVWLTGLSGAGKSTLAMALEHRLFDAGRNVYVLDGDIVRGGLCSDLGFSPDDRAENIRRVGEVARIMADAGLLVVVAFISPFRADRDRVRACMPAGRFTEVHVSTPLEICEKRDTKGLYAKARAGELPDFTGISSPYEAPESPEVRLPTEKMSVDECVDSVVAVLA